MEDVKNLKKSDAKKAGGYMKEKLIIARSRLTSNEVERAIYKATSHKLKPPNEKHVARLLEASHGHYSDDDRVTMSKIVNELKKRLHSHNWIVVLKGLATLHTLLKQGSKAMVLAICQHSGLFHTSHLKDLDDDRQGLYSDFITKYARYLEEWCMTYLHMNCMHTMDKPKELAAELEAMSTHKAIRATKCLSLQLGLLVSLDFASSATGNLWNENECTTYCLHLVLKDSKNLYILLSHRSLWLLKHGKKLNDGEKQDFLGIFTQYMQHSDQLLRMFEDLQKTKFGKLYKDRIPTLTNYPKETIDQLTRYLATGSDPAGQALSNAFSAEIASGAALPAIVKLPDEDDASDDESPTTSPTPASRQQAANTEAFLENPQAFTTPQKPNAPAAAAHHDPNVNLFAAASAAAPAVPPPAVTAASEDFFDPRAGEAPAKPAATTLAPPQTTQRAASPLDDLFAPAPVKPQPPAASSTAPVPTAAASTASFFPPQPQQPPADAAFPFPGQQAPPSSGFPTQPHAAPQNSGGGFLQFNDNVSINSVWPQSPLQTQPPPQQAPQQPRPAQTLDDLFA
eukprot:TRINITY_DN7413_c0_g1_i1.p1 TRINITY_DN7413_c0_g1~~TRINITY_DN7413_c0_g1_i1.p1  ORF type:complete len:568 (+),score=219.45 TRINITY_DN7413_c0_g1_i1:67-1770(+)